MKILLCLDKTQGDDSYVHHIQRMAAVRGVDLAVSYTPRESAADLALVAKKHGCDAVATTQLGLLKAALAQSVDFIPSKKQPTLDAYAGSVLDLPLYGMELLILNPLERLLSVPYEKFIVNRYLSKITLPGGWFPQSKFRWVQVTEQNSQECLDALLAAPLMACDIETKPENRIIDMVNYTIQTADGGTMGYVVLMDSEWAIDFCERVNASKAEKIFQHGQYDNAYFLRFAMPINNWLWDTYNMLHCWYSEFPKNLAFIGAFALRKIRYWKDDGKSGRIEDEMRYNAMDGWATLNGFLSIMSEWPEWAANNYLQEFPMNFPALHAGMEGILRDKEVFDRVVVEKNKQAEEKLAEIRYMLDEPAFNPRSPVQMKDLYRVLGCAHLSHIENAKARALKARALSPLNDMVLGEIEEYTKAAKLISTYLPEENFWNNRWYYELDPAKTDTGRAASVASFFWCGNQIQNVPRGDAIKQFMIADDGWHLAECDKAQSEARCVGYLSGEEALIELVEGSKDYHSWNASKFFGIPYEKIYDEATRTTLDEELRDLSKRTNHGANYNMGDGVMLDTMGPKKVAKAKETLKLWSVKTLKGVCAFLLNQYERTYPKVKGLFYEHIISTISSTSKLESPFGWTRYFFNKPSRSNKPALNAAVAHPPQNLSVAIINREWYSIWYSTVYGELRGLVRVKAQIHDSILFQYRAGRLDIARRVQQYMRTSVAVRDPLGVTRTMLIPTDLKAGARAWSALKKVK